ncbi:hypothetical protein BDY21DRAFT_270377, partial [Lineolata rhizophorae]
MGAGQSSASAAGGAPTSSEPKTSYYALLSIDRAASTDDIKRAYRRKALELHPDRNYGREAAATALFAEVQTAYEVLSDPHERAWYDAHEGAILRGDDPLAPDGQNGGAAGAAGGPVYQQGVRITTADDIARMMRRFHSGVPFSDAPDGFFGFLRETFETLAREEGIAARAEGVAAPDYPSFGHAADTHADVAKPFYAAWAAFATRKSFAWRDAYKLADAPDRRTRRWMEKENRRLRDEAAREFNDAVRALVAFARKRDPRFEPDARSDAQRQEELRRRAREQARRARERNAAAAGEGDAVPEWARRRTEDDNGTSAQPSAHANEAGEEVWDGESSADEEFECVACRKRFKSEKQFEAHERSKKHQKAVAALRRKMRKENRNLNLDDDEDEDYEEEDDEDRAPEGGEAEAHIADAPEEAKRDANGAHASLADGIKSMRVAADTTSEGDGDPESGEDDPDDDGADDDNDSDYALRDTVSARLAGNELSLDPDPDLNTAAAATSQPKLGKAAQKRAKKAAAAVAAAAQDSSRSNKFRCAVCAADFPSRTRLFQHIGDFGHAA